MRAPSGTIRILTQGHFVCALAANRVVWRQAAIHSAAPSLREDLRWEFDVVNRDVCL